MTSTSGSKEYNCNHDHNYKIYNDWLDDYNRDETQPMEIPPPYRLREAFPELGQFEAVQIIVDYFQNKERELGGG